MTRVQRSQERLVAELTALGGYVEDPKGLVVRYLYERLGYENMTSVTALVLRAEKSGRILVSRRGKRTYAVALTGARSWVPMPRSETAPWTSPVEDETPEETAVVPVPDTDAPDAPDYDLLAASLLKKALEAIQSPPIDMTLIADLEEERAKAAEIRRTLQSERLVSQAHQADRDDLRARVVKLEERLREANAATERERERANTAVEAQRRSQERLHRRGEPLKDRLRPEDKTALMKLMAEIPAGPVTS